jgi:hypothetical protein
MTVGLPRRKGGATTATFRMCAGAQQLPRWGGMRARSTSAAPEGSRPGSGDAGSGDGSGSGDADRDADTAATAQGKRRPARCT